MVNINPEKLSTREIYKLMTGTIVPRPIAWVSTQNAQGEANLAPFSYFNAVSADPPTLMFSIGTRGGQPKDTLKNIEQVKAFVVNISTEATAEAMNKSAIDSPYGVSEFELTGLTPVPSSRISVPRVLESPVNFECTLHDIYSVGTNSVIFGKIVHIHIADNVLLDNYRISVEALKPVGRLAGNSYTKIERTFNLERPIFEDQTKS